MNRNEARDLFRKYNTDTATPQERSLLEHWYSETLLDRQQDPTGDDLLSLKHEAWSAIYAQTVPVRRVKLWPRIAAAVAVVTIIFGAGLFYFSQDSKQVGTNQISYKNDIAPGKQGATLTLANGKKVRLTDAANGELAKEAGVVITKSASGQVIYEIRGSDAQSNKINTLSTAKGETYQLRLPDGSLVWLNSASTLTYSPILTKNGQRSVKLEGEAYFEIQKDKTHPFIVESKGQQVEVLGTQFNINAYHDEPIAATTLVEGSVKINAQGNDLLLKPGEQGINNGKTLLAHRVEIENITDWKNGDFYMDGIDFKVAMRKIARWYNVEVIYDDSVPTNIKSGGWMSRSNKLSAILQSIEKSGMVHFKIIGQKVYVSK
ncbi:MAG: FecR domain-containing protein [Pedobacter sp.]|uniref:FecR family protein n=1 Tax=Pedobacter sp. TaxID=1411316 RepID=UPI0035683BA2